MSNQFIEKLQKVKSKYANPTQASTQAKSLDLLSSGIYTEEERFVFELLQNAVDAYNGNSCLDVKILLLDDYLVFMHNGDCFTERDIEGLCDVGYGNKMADVKKIGYKGIGFKSVFMHSKLVTVQSGKYCFKFEKDKWENYWDPDWGTKDSNRTYTMPWQIIPIDTTIPISVDTSGYNVATYIYTIRTHSLREKIEKLFSTSNFLLFLRHSHINIDFFDGNKLLVSIKKRTDGDIVELSTNNVLDSKWLVYCNPEVTIDEEVRKIVAADGITPIKLQEAKTFDVSFALLLDKSNRVASLENSCVYTYLPTSISFGFPFLVNANFITDAGRQHLVNDSEWNKMIVKVIPNEFLGWMSKISRQYSTYYKALPMPINNGENLCLTFNEELSAAIKDIAFIPSLGQNMLKANEAVMDRVGLTKVLPKNILLRHINEHYHHVFNEDSFINNGGIAVLREYGVFEFDAGKLIGLFEDEKAFEGISIDSDIKLINFLFDYSNGIEDNRSTIYAILSQVRFLYAEDGTLDCPKNLFFPSNYRDRKSIARGAKVLHSDLYQKLTGNSDLISWLRKIGLCDMDAFSIINNLLTREDYVTEKNAIDIGRFIFNTFKKYGSLRDSCPKVSRIKFLTKKNSLKPIEDLFLGHEFRPDFDLESQYDEDVFVSDLYAGGMNLDEWALFFRSMGICTGVHPKELQTSWYDMPIFTQNFLQSCKDAVLKKSNPYMGWKNPFTLHYFSLYYFPLISVKGTAYGLAKIVWSYILKDRVPFFTEDRACGVYGCCLKVSFAITEWTHRKYGPWVLSNHQTFPASTGEMLKANALFKNTPVIKEICGKYLPYIDVDCEIDSSWNSLLSFKTSLSLNDYLTILNKIAEDEKYLNENKERISRIYQRIVSDFNYSSIKNAELIKKWAGTSRILSREGVFCSPTELRHITLDGFGDKHRVYIGQVENKDKVIDLLSIMGVKIITENNVKTEIENKKENDEIKRCLMAKVKVLALLKTGEKPTQNEYDKAEVSITRQLKETHFYHCSSIRLAYGDENDTIEKVTFGNGSGFFYTGELRLAKIDPLVTPLCSFLGLKGKERELIITMFEDMNAIREYLQEKEYDISYIKYVEYIGLCNPTPDYAREDQKRRREAHIKHLGEVVVYEKLKDMGYSPICLSLTDGGDYVDKIEYRERTYYFRENNNYYDMEFKTPTGRKMLARIEAMTFLKNEQDAVRYGGLLLSEKYGNNSDKGYVTIRVFNVERHPDIFILEGHTI